MNTQSEPLAPVDDRSIEEKLATMTCTLSGPGRGDCAHAVGLPGKSIHGAHDGDDDTVDHTGKPNGWCNFCWQAYQLEQLRVQLENSKLNYRDTFRVNYMPPVCKYEDLAEPPEDTQIAIAFDLSKASGTNYFIYRERVWANESVDCPDPCSFVTNIISVPKAFEVLKCALNADSSYAWGWHCNLAMAMYDSIPSELMSHELKHEYCNEGAARFMKLCFNVDTKPASSDETAEIEVNPKDFGFYLSDTGVLICAKCKKEACHCECVTSKDLLHAYVIACLGLPAETKANTGCGHGNCGCKSNPEV